MCMLVSWTLFVTQHSINQRDINTSTPHVWQGVDVSPTAILVPGYLPPGSVAVAPSIHNIAQARRPTLPRNINDNLYAFAKGVGAVDYFSHMSQQVGNRWSRAHGFWKRHGGWCHQSGARHPVNFQSYSIILGAGAWRYVIFAHRVSVTKF